MRLSGNSVRRHGTLPGLVVYSTLLLLGRAGSTLCFGLHCVFRPLGTGAPPLLGEALVVYAPGRLFRARPDCLSLHERQGLDVVPDLNSAMRSFSSPYGKERTEPALKLPHLGSVLFWDLLSLSFSLCWCLV
jgi:hypothetical protein